MYLHFAKPNYRQNYVDVTHQKLKQAPLVEIVNLKKHFVRSQLGAGTPERIRALDGANLQIFPGEIVGLAGESGSGKTTLLKCLFRITKLTSGQIFFMGKSISTFNSQNLLQFRRQAQLIFQNPDTALNPRLKIGNLIAEPLIAHRLSDRKSGLDCAREILDQVGLNAQLCKSYVAELSVGQRQRVLIARALILRPKLLAADEPFSNLDVLAKSRILDLLLTLKERFGLTYFLVSHDLRLIEDICDRIAVIRDGKISISKVLQKSAKK
jgi:peptide/nickel transport system ATP-binding protein